MNSDILSNKAQNYEPNRKERRRIKFSGSKIKRKNKRIGTTPEHKTKLLMSGKQKIKVHVKGKLFKFTFKQISEGLHFQSLEKIEKELKNT